MLRPLAALVLVLGCGACLPAPADQPSFTLYYHWSSPLHVPHFRTVEIMSDGRASCDIAYAGGRGRSDLELTPQEVAYFEALFRRVLALDREAIEKTGAFMRPAGFTTWRMVKWGKTKEVSYAHTDNPWATDLEQDMRRFAAREFALATLAEDDPKARYNAAYDVLSDLKQGRIFRPEDLRAPLLAAAWEWPAPGLSLDHSRDTIANLFQALAYCESPEQWVGDVMELYARQPHESRAIMLRAIAESNLLSELEGDRGRMLVPLMSEGLIDMLHDRALPDGENVWHAALSLINALGSLRDPRAVNALSSTVVWRTTRRPNVASWAASALCAIGMPGIRALIERADSPDAVARGIARHALSTAAQRYAFAWWRDAPSPAQVDEVREFLVERGLGPEGTDAFDIADAAANSLHQSYPGWRYIMSSEFSGPVLQSLYEWDSDPRKRGPQRCRLDYDGNGLEDIALLIRKDDEFKLVVLLQTSGGCWTTDELTSLSHGDAYDESYRGIAIFIAPAPPQTIIRPASPGDDRSITFHTTGIALHRGEEPAGTVFYWTGDGVAPDAASP